MNSARNGWERFCRRAPAGLEVYAEETRRTTLRWEEGRLAEVVDASDAGVGLRRLGQTIRFSSMEACRPVTGDLTGPEADRLLRQAALLGGPPSPSRSVPFPSLPRPASVPDSLKEMKAWLARAERAARRDSRVRQVRLTLGRLHKDIAGLTPERTGYAERRRAVTFVVQVTAEAGALRQSGTEVRALQGGWESLARADPSRLAALAARRALAKLDAAAVPAGEMPVVIAAQAGGTLIHEAVGHSLEADSILDGSSPHFAGKKGRRVANEKISVLDDPTLKGHRGSFRFDDEGTPAERTALIERGVLKTYLFDRRSAARAGRASNGHGRRESFAHPPIPRMSNTFIAPGPDDPKRILAETPRGLYVTRLGGGQVNTATGDFVFEVEEGFLIEDGRAGRPVRGANLLGNGPDVLLRIDRVGWDIGWSVGTCGKEGQGVPVADGLPTLRIPKVVVGGA